MTNPPRDRLSLTLERLGDAVAWEAWPEREGIERYRASPDSVARALERARSTADGGAYVEIFDGHARAAARVQADERDARPLAGIPLAVKDLIAVAGHPLRAGSAHRDAARAEPADAPIVAILRGLGAVPVGLVALHEFAFGVTGVNEHSGFPANPCDAQRIPGGSSCGSAVAVAEGSALVALGTDTGGSVRIPAALCGVVGFKPRRDEYPTAGVLPLAPSLDHVGLLAPSVVLVRTVHAALGHDPGREVLPTTVGVVDDDVSASDPAVRDRVRHALAALVQAGARTVPVPWPEPERSFATSTTLLFAEAAAVHRRALRDAPERFAADVRRRLEAGMRIDAPSYVAAKRDQQLLGDQVERCLHDVDVVVGPTVPILAPRIAEAGDPEVSAQLVRHTRLVNVVGYPALSLPLPGDGLPVGLQLVARDSARLLGAAAAIERVLRQSEA